MQKIIAAALSPTIVPGDKERNLESAHRGLCAAKEQGVQLALFSEWYLTHCIDERSFGVAEPVPDGPTVQVVIKFAQELKMTVAMGIEELDPERGVVYNTHFLTGLNGYIGKHRKTHLMIDEWQAHRAGSTFKTFDIGAARVGISICHENMYPETSRILALQGAEILLSPFGCGGTFEPTTREKWQNDFHMACWRARCLDNGVYMVVSGDNGAPENGKYKPYKTYGCIIDPFGEVVAAIEPQPHDPEINLVVAELDPSRIAARRADANYPLKKRRPEIYGSLVEMY
jgi:predicted amidohydrolase